MSNAIITHSFQHIQYFEWQKLVFGHVLIWPHPWLTQTVAFDRNYYEIMLTQRKYNKRNCIDRSNLLAARSCD